MVEIQRHLDRTIIVTGAARGMGEAHCRRLADEGANVIVADLDHDGGTRLADQIRAAGGTAAFVDCDVTSVEDWGALAETAIATYGAIHGLINNAGIVSNHRIATIDRERWNLVMAVNLTGTFLGLKTIAPLIHQSGGGAIVNVSSAAGISVHPDPAYAGSKWAVRGLTKVAAMEFATWGVRVNSIHPGYFDTPMNDFADEHLRAAKLSILPLGRPGDPSEAAALASYLLSDEAGFVTGAEIVIDGGYTAGSQCLESRRGPGPVSRPT
jgi:3alpha(or 20beta)-hydroxysteroid dehydrogenase